VGEVMLVTAAYLAKYLGLTTQEAATILAKACEAKEIYGQDFQGRCFYEVTNEWMEKHHVSIRRLGDA
jgi:hypothetical protein